MRFGVLEDTKHSRRLSCLKRDEGLRARYVPEDDFLVNLNFWSGHDFHRRGRHSMAESRPCPRRKSSATCANGGCAVCRFDLVGLGSPFNGSCLYRVDSTMCRSTASPHIPGLPGPGYMRSFFFSYMRFGAMLKHTCSHFQLRPVARERVLGSWWASTAYHEPSGSNHTTVHARTGGGSQYLSIGTGAGFGTL